MLEPSLGVVVCWRDGAFPRMLKSSYGGSFVRILKSSLVVVFHVVPPFVWWNFCFESSCVSDFVIVGAALISRCHAADVSFR